MLFRSKKNSKKESKGKVLEKKSSSNLLLNISKFYNFKPDLNNGKAKTTLKPKNNELPSCSNSNSPNNRRNTRSSSYLEKSPEPKKKFKKIKNKSSEDEVSDSSFSLRDFDSEVAKRIKKNSNFEQNGKDKSKKNGVNLFQESDSDESNLNFNSNSESEESEEENPEGW